MLVLWYHLISRFSFSRSPTIDSLASSLLPSTGEHQHPSPAQSEAPMPKHGMRSTPQIPCLHLADERAVLDFERHCHDERDLHPPLEWHGTYISFMGLVD